MRNRTLVVVKGILQFKQKVLIVRRDEKDPVGPGTWEFVGGKVDYGETLEGALLREIKEETGLIAEITQLLYATTFMTESKIHIVVLAYQCSVKDDKVTLSEEHNNYKWVGEKEVRVLISPGIIADMKKYNAFPLIFG